MEKVSFKYRAEFLTKQGKRKKVVMNNANPNLKEEQLTDILETMAGLTKLFDEDDEQALVAPLNCRLVEKRDDMLVDHEADGSLLAQQRQQYLMELIIETCQSQRISLDHLSDGQLKAIGEAMMPYVLQKYPEKKSRNYAPAISMNSSIRMQDAVKKYTFEERQFPTFKELTQNSIFKNVAMMKDYYKRGGDQDRLLEGIHLLQIREMWTGERFLVGDVLRYELEEIYQAKSWSEHLQIFFKPMLRLMGNLTQVQLLKRVLNEQRAAGLEKVVEDGEETTTTQAATDIMLEKLEQLAKMASAGGLNACGVPV